jgi:hypothetical protein
MEIFLRGGLDSGEPTEGIGENRFSARAHAAAGWRRNDGVSRRSITLRDFLICPSGRFSALASGLLLLFACIIGAGMTPQIASAEETAPVVAGVVSGATESGRPDVAPMPDKMTPDVTPDDVTFDKVTPDKIVPRPEPQTQGAVARTPNEESKQDSKQDAGQRTPGHAGKDGRVPQLVLSADMARKIGRKIWLNEAGGNRDAITSWNANEDFASLGVGHFIWFPAGKTPPFEESFPRLLEFLRKANTRLPSWLDRTPIPSNPWTSRADFKNNFNSAEMRELRQFLLDTVPEQTQFLVVRAQGAMDKILAHTPDSAEREHIVIQFSRIARASGDLYPLIDYINFKGEGTNPAETTLDKATGRRQGWGLKQALLRMNGSTDDPKAVRAEFADAAQAVLQQRVRNIPSHRIWEAGWLRRVATYRQPIAELEAHPRRVRRATLRVRAVR